MKKLIYLLFILMVTSCGKEAQKYTAVPTGSTVLVLGDSLSYGTGANNGANTGEDYPSLLAKSTGWNIINKGVPGDTTAGGLARLPALLTEHQPKLLIVELVGNDLLHQTAPAEITSNLKAILSAAKAQGIQAILVAIPEISPLKATFGNLSDHPLYETVATETNTPLIAEVFSNVLSDKDLKSDQIHANAKGYAVVSDELREKLKAQGFLH